MAYVRDGAEWSMVTGDSVNTYRLSIKPALGGKSVLIERTWSDNENDKVHMFLSVKELLFLNEFIRDEVCRRVFITQPNLVDGERVPEV
jgi:hypothetical protein